METTPAKILDMDSGKFIDNPELKQPDPKGAAETEVKEEETDEEEEEEEQESEGEEQESEEEEGEESEGEEEEAEEEEEEKPKPEAKKTAKDKEEAVTADAYIEEVFGPKYGIKTEADLMRIIENGADAQAEVESLKKKISESGEPKFKDPKRQSAFEFVNRFDPKHQGEALQTWAKLVGMDVDTADAMMVLEEKFIHDSPHYTRSQAQRMFKKDHDKRYTLKKEDFGTDAEYEEEVKDMEIMKQGEVAKARAFLKDLQAKHKPSDTEDKPVVNELVTKAVEKNTKEYASAVDKMQEFKFESDGMKYTFKLDSAKKKALIDGLTGWVKNPASYDDKGNLLGGPSTEEMINTYIGGMFLNDILKSFASQMKNQAEGKRIEELGTKKPSKRSAPTGGDGGGGDDLASSARRIIKQKRQAA